MKDLFLRTAIWAFGIGAMVGIFILLFVSASAFLGCSHFQPIGHECNFTICAPLESVEMYAHAKAQEKCNHEYPKCRCELIGIDERCVYKYVWGCACSP